MKKNLHILVVDDDEDVASAAAILLRTHGFSAETETNPEILLKKLESRDTTLLLLDMNFKGSVYSGNEGLYWLKQVKKRFPNTVVIMITGYGDVELAVKAIKAGANDFILKPWQNDKLLGSISTAIKLHEAMNGRNRTLQAASAPPEEDFIGSSDKVQEIVAAVQKVAPTDANVLITGENGTGKEMVARMLHRLSDRSTKPFVTVDVGALSDTLFESELFGHVKGAFTDAREDRAGRFEAANGGTLFLDEIGNLAPARQAKLLAALQNREIYRVGSNQPIPVDIRLVSATNMPLQQMVRDRIFRQDLLYRINTVELHLPPLRERKTDIGLLAGHFVGVYCDKYEKPLKTLHPLAVKQLEKYHWPGNVRELQHAIERAVILNDGDELLPGDFFLPLYDYSEEIPDDAVQKLEENELQLIKKALQKHNGNISKAAAELGITRASLYRRIEKYGI